MIRDKAVGLFISQSQSIISDSYVIRLIEGMSQILNRKRYSLILQPLRLTEQNYVEIARSDDLDGVVLLNAHDDDTGIGELKEAGFPLVVIGTLADPSIVQVDIDNRSAATEMTSYLLSLGHERIGMIVHAPLVFHAARERLMGFRSALEAAGAPYDENYVRVADYTEESGFIAMTELLALDRRPTAVFAGNDMMAYGAYKALRDAGLAIPEDVSVVGFDDDYLSRYLNPGLTTMSLPAAGLGSIAAGMVAQEIVALERHSRAGVSPRQTILPTHMTVRSSCRQL